MTANKRYIEYLLLAVFAVAAWGVNQRNVDYLNGLSADEWLTNIPVRSEPGDYKNSLHLRFFNELSVFADNAALEAHKRWGISPVALDKGQLLAQTLLILFGTYMMASALGLGPSGGALAVLFAFSSTFTWMGRYLQLQVTYYPSHSGVAFGFGLVIFAMFFKGRRALPIVIAGLLGVWHPSHAVVILLFMWSYMAFHVRREGGILRVGMFAALQAAALVPTYIMTLPQQAKLAPLAPGAAAMWWQLMEARTTNIFPLNDGLVMIADVWLGIAAAFLIPFAAAKLGKGGGRFRGVGMAAWVVLWLAGLWALQIGAAHFIHNTTLTRFALTRGTPYAVVLVCVFMAGALDELFDARKLFAWLCVALAVFLAILLRLHVPLIAAVAAYYAFHLSGGARKWRTVNALGLAALGLLAASGLLLHASDTFHLLGGAALVAASKLVRVTLILSMAATVVAMAAMFALLFMQRDTAKQSGGAEGAADDNPKVVRAAVFAGMTLASLAVNIAIMGTNFPYDLRFIGHTLRSDAEARLDVQKWALEHTPKGSLFVLNPMRFGGFEQTAHRPSLGTREDISYPLYAVDMLDDVYNRLKIFGADPMSPDLDARCGLKKSLAEPRCRQTLFYEKMEAEYPSAVISNLDKLLKDYTNARYLVVEKDKAVDAGFGARHPVVYRNSEYRVYDLRGAI